MLAKIPEEEPDSWTVSEQGDDSSISELTYRCSSTEKVTNFITTFRSEKIFNVYWKNFNDFFEASIICSLFMVDTT